MGKKGTDQSSLLFAGPVYGLLFIRYAGEGGIEVTAEDLVDVTVAAGEPPQGFHQLVVDLLVGKAQYAIDQFFRSVRARPEESTDNPGGIAIQA